MTARVPMTTEGYEELNREISWRKSVERQRIINAIKVAREHGDLKENAEYHAAREEQSHNEGRIQAIDEKIAHAQVVDVTKIDNLGKVIFGATVHLINLDTDQEHIYKIVGEDEADVKSSKISVTSPISRAIVGKETGEEVEVITPAGPVSYTIERVDYV